MIAVGVVPYLYAVPESARHLRAVLPTSTRRALARAKADDRTLINMRMRMPRMDGLEATRRIRGLPIRAHTPILAMTGNAFREDREECLASDMNDLIPKPVPLEWLPAPSKPGV